MKEKEKKKEGNNWDGRILTNKLKPKHRYYMFPILPHLTDVH